MPCVVCASPSEYTIHAPRWIAARRRLLLRGQRVCSACYADSRPVAKMAGPQ